MSTCTTCTPNNCIWPKCIGETRPNHVEVGMCSGEFPVQPKSTHLLPCPFCGTKPEWVYEVHPAKKPGIKCPSCQFIIVEDRRDKTIETWNRRRESAVSRLPCKVYNGEPYGLYFMIDGSGDFWWCQYYSHFTRTHDERFPPQTGKSIEEAAEKMLKVVEKTSFFSGADIPKEKTLEDIAVSTTWKKSIRDLIDELIEKENQGFKYIELLTETESYEPEGCEGLIEYTQVAKLKVE